MRHYTSGAFLFFQAYCPTLEYHSGFTKPTSWIMVLSFESSDLYLFNKISRGNILICPVVRWITVAIIRGNNCLLMFLPSQIISHSNFFWRVRASQGMTKIIETYGISWQPKLSILWSCQNMKLTISLRSSRRDGQKTYMECLIRSPDKEVMPSERCLVVGSSDPSRDFRLSEVPTCVRTSGKPEEICSGV